MCHLEPQSEHSHLKCCSIQLPRRSSRSSFACLPQLKHVLPFATMSFPYKRVLLVGATAGIGAAFADRLIQEGVKVIAVGRRQERLDAFAEKHGEDKASATKLDIREGARIDEFVHDVTTSFPDLDCVFLNAGVASPINLAQPESFDLAAFHSQVALNFSSFVDLTVKFLPFLMSKKTETSVIL